MKLVAAGELSRRLSARGNDDLHVRNFVRYVNEFIGSFEKMSADYHKLNAAVSASLAKIRAGLSKEGFDCEKLKAEILTLEKEMQEFKKRWWRASVSPPRDFTSPHSSFNILAAPVRRAPDRPPALTAGNVRMGFVRSGRRRRYGHTEAVSMFATSESTPEKGEPFYKEARRRNAELINRNGKEITLSSAPRSLRQIRQDACVGLDGRGREVNEVLLKEGLKNPHDTSVRA